MKKPASTKKQTPPKTLAHRLRHLHRRTVHHLRHTFIPHAGNNFQPHALRPHALAWYATIVIVAKLAVTALLFTAYPTPGYFSSATAGRFLELTNSARDSSDIVDLKMNPKLEKAAAKKAQAILGKGTFAHTIDNKPFWWWIKQEGYKYSTAGENLALDFVDADIAQKALMNSPGHRANILNKKYTQVGIAVKSGTFQGRETTVVVFMFAKPLPVVSRPKVATAAETTAPASPEQAVTPVAPAQPDYAAVLRSPPVTDVSLKPGQAHVVTVDVENIGTAEWRQTGDDAVYLQTIDPAGRESLLASGSWVSPSRPVAVAPDAVKTGRTGHWVFSIVAPQAIGLYAERFALVRSDGTLLPKTEVTLNLSVEPAVDPAPITAPAEAGAPPSAPAETSAIDPFLTSESLSPDGEVKAIAPEAAQTPAVTTSPILASAARNAAAASTNLFLFFAAFLTVALMTNLLVRYEVQHRHIVLGTLFLIALTGLMVAVGFHFLDILPAGAVKIL